MFIGNSDSDFSGDQNTVVVSYRDLFFIATSIYAAMFCISFAIQALEAVDISKIGRPFPDNKTRFSVCIAIDSIFIYLRLIFVLFVILFVLYGLIGGI